ncbi:MULTISPECIES: AAA family ATPase [unclassified Frigoribacterium]|uniref:AAA family ATPase n=1 Tax=unclassified Frigoribacterium TaxID=2627005 RepID=UPI00156668BD|nr:MULTISPECIES: AAA family ATPase [unclassified Frigoribacterium]NQW87677.1 AAA family ATPase [Frigoribacterium sp. VKM Ac-2860]NQX09514.1 AAA family ATPase [Frigoribacterium sp. VKM Ac-2859]
MKLQTVSIFGFRSVENLVALRVGSPLVLAGHNDAGKSTIIDAILFLLGTYKLTDSDRTYLDEGESEEVDVPPEPRRVSQTSVEGDFGLREHEVGDHGGALSIRLRRVSQNGAAGKLEMLVMAPVDARLRDYETLTVQPLKDRLATLDLAQSGTKTELIERLAEAAAGADQEERWVAAPSSLERQLPTVKRFDASSAVNADAAIQSTLQTAFRAHLESDEFSGDIRAIEEGLEGKLVADAQAIREHIAEKVSDVGEVIIRPMVNLSNANGLKATQVTVQNSRGEAIDLRLSGAGRARRIALAVWEFNATLLAGATEDIVLLYDEPDTHLDYGHQRELMRLIHEQTRNPNVTVVIASHSMNLIDGTDIGDVAHIKHVGHRTVVERLTDDAGVGDHLGAIAASVGLRNTVLLHERLFVGVEGDSEARALPVLFRLAMGRHLESCGIAIWPCNNNEGAVRFATFLVRHSRTVAFLVDRDSQTNAKHIFSDVKLKKEGLDPEKHCLYIGENDEIEDVFSDEQWAAAANTLWQRDGENEVTNTWSASDFGAHRSGKFSSQILDMLKNGSTSAPYGKPEALRDLALTLRDASEVPAPLVEVFKDLVRRAS